MTYPGPFLRIRPARRRNRMAGAFRAAKDSPKDQLPIAYDWFRGSVAALDAGGDRQLARELRHRVAQALAEAADEADDRLLRRPRRGDAA